MEFYLIFSLIASVLLTAHAAFWRAVFEAILFYDTPKYVFGSDYWSMELFASNKDRNKDGKVSYMEDSFPDDGGHLAKRIEIVSLATAVGTLVVAFTGISLWWAFAVPVGFALVHATTFELTLRWLRKAKR